MAAEFGKEIVASRCLVNDIRGVLPSFDDNLPLPSTLVTVEQAGAARAIASRLLFAQADPFGDTEQFQNAMDRARLATHGDWPAVADHIRELSRQNGYNNGSGLTRNMLHRLAREVDGD